MKKQSNIFIMIAITLLACGQLWGGETEADKKRKEEDIKREAIIDDIESAKKDIEGKVDFSEIYEQIETIGAEVSELDDAQFYSLQYEGQPYSLQPSIIDIKTEYGELEQKFADALFENVETLFIPIMTLIGIMKEDVKKYKKVNIVDIDDKISDIISYLDDLHPILLMPYLSTDSTDPTWEKLHKIKLNMHEFLTNYIAYITGVIDYSKVTAYVQSQSLETKENLDYLTKGIRQIEKMLDSVQKIVPDNEKEGFKTSISEGFDNLKAKFDDRYKRETITNAIEKAYMAIKKEKDKNPILNRNINFSKIYKNIESINEDISALKDNELSQHMQERYRSLHYGFAYDLFDNLTTLETPIIKLIDRAIDATKEHGKEMRESFRWFAENVVSYLNAAFQEGLILNEKLIGAVSDQYKNTIDLSTSNISKKLKNLFEAYIGHITKRIELAQGYFSTPGLVFFHSLESTIKKIKSILTVAQETFLNGQIDFINYAREELKRLEKLFKEVYEEFSRKPLVTKKTAQLAVLATTTAAALRALNGDSKLAIVAIAAALGAIVPVLSTVLSQVRSGEKTQKQILQTAVTALSGLSSKMKSFLVPHPE